MEPNALESERDQAALVEGAAAGCGTAETEL